MKKSISITTVVLLVLAIIFLFLTYRQYTGTRDKLLNCETNLADINKKVSQLTREKALLQEKEMEDSKRIEDLQKAQTRISEQEKFEAVSIVKELKSRQETIVSKLNQEIRRFDENLSVLHEKLRIKTAYAHELEEKLSKVRGESDILKQDVSALKEEKRLIEDRLARAEQERSEADSAAEQLKARHAAVVSKLSREILSRDDSLSALTEQKGRLEGQLAQIERDCKDEASRLNGEIHNRDARIAELEKDRDRLASQADGLSRDVQAREERIAFLEQRISTLFGEQEMLKTRIGRLETTHRSMVSELQGEIAKKEVTIHELEDKLTITFVDRILFDFGRATISSEGKEVLMRVGKLLKNTKDRKIRVIGHTDNIPIMNGFRYKFPSNWELSSARAAAVVRLFQDEIGLPPEILEAVGRSFYDPIATNETQAGRAQNRRVNITISHRGE